MPHSELDLDYFRRELTALRDRLMEDARSGDEAAEVVEADQSRMGRLSRMDALQGQAMSIETRRRRKVTVEKISRALHRIEVGEFGTCAECGEPIATARLKADPTVTLCVACAERAESGP
jgi:DnaK suppressor protein